MPIVAQQITVNITADLSGLKHGMQQAEADAHSSGGRLKGIFGGIFSTAAGVLAAAGIQTGIGAIVGGFGDLIKTGIDVNKQFQNLQAQLTSITGSSGAAQGIMDWVRKFGTQVPDTTEHLAQAVVTIQSLGVNAEQVMPSLANIAAAMGTDLPTAAQAFADAYEGRFQMLQMQLHVNKEELVKYGLELDKHGHVLNNSLVTAVENLQKAKFPDGLKQGMSTFSGQMSNLVDQFQFFAAAITKPIFAMFQTALQNVLGFLSSHADLVQGFADMIGNVLAGALTFAGNVLGWLATQVGNFIGFVAPIIAFLVHLLSVDLQPAFAAIRDIVSTLLLPFQQIGQAMNNAGVSGAHLGTILTPLSDFFWQIAMAVDSFFQSFDQLVQGMIKGTGAFGGIREQVQAFAQALSPLVGFVQVLWQDMGLLASVLSGQLKQSFEHMKATWGPVLQAVGNSFTQYILPAVMGLIPPIEGLINTFITEGIPAFFAVRDALSQVAAIIVTDLLPVWNAIAPLVLKLTGYILSLANMALKELLPKIQEAAKAVGDFAQGLGQRLQPFILLVTSTIQQGAAVIAAVWNYLWPTMSAVLKTTWDYIGNIIKLAWDLITGIFNVAADLLSGKWGQLWTDLKSLVTKPIGDIKDAVTGLWTDLKGVFQSIASDLGGIWNGIWSGLGGIVSGAWNGVKQAVEGLINGAIDILNSMIDAANHIPFVNISHISHVNFAGGGIMGQTGLALVGEQGPELVALPHGAQVFNAGQTQQMLEDGRAGTGPLGASGGSGGTQQPIILQVDGKTLARILVKHLPGVIANATGNRDY